MTDAIIMTVESVRTRASTNEALLTFAVPLENAVAVSGFMAKIGCQVAAAFAEVHHVEGAADKGIQRGRDSLPSSRADATKPFGSHAKALKLSGFFLHPEVLQTLGTDDAYREWIQRQPSAWSNEFSEYVNGEGRCEAAHCRRINTGAGMQIKNDYACIPLTHEEHRKQSDHGESVFDLQNSISGREWFERKRAEYVTKWGWLQLREIMEVESMADADPKAVFEWARFHNIDQFLPMEYRDV